MIPSLTKIPILQPKSQNGTEWSAVIPELEKRLRAAFSDAQLTLIDDSGRHAGHAGALEGGHFELTVVSDAFVGRSLVERHKLVYAALGDLMQTGVHALTLVARTGAEAKNAR